MKTAQQIPTVPPLAVDDVADAIAFYVATFGAVEAWRECLLDGRPVSAMLAVGGHRLTISEWCDADTGGTTQRPATLVVKCTDPSALTRRAVAAGALVEAESIVDPYGRRWVITAG